MKIFGIVIANDSMTHILTLDGNQWSLRLRHDVSCHGICPEETFCRFFLQLGYIFLDLFLLSQRLPSFFHLRRAARCSCFEAGHDMENGPIGYPWFQFFWRNGAPKKLSPGLGQVEGKTIPHRALEKKTPICATQTLTPGLSWILYIHHWFCNFLSQQCFSMLLGSNSEASWWTCHQMASWGCSEI